MAAIISLVVAVTFNSQDCAMSQGKDGDMVSEERRKAPLGKASMAEKDTPMKQVFICSPFHPRA